MGDSPMKETGRKIKCMEQALITIWMDQFTMENGNKTNKVEKGLFNYQMELFMKVNGSIS